MSFGHTSMRDKFRIILSDHVYQVSQYVVSLLTEQERLCK